MASTVSDILDQARSIAAAVLTDYKALRFVTELTRNDGRDAAKAYGVRPLSASTLSSVTNSELLEHQFEFVISDTLARYDSEGEIEDVLSTLYDKLDQIFKQFVNLKMNLAGTVVQVDDRSLEEPILQGMNVYVPMRFLVKYRQSLL